MGIKIFDLPPGGLKDGGKAELNTEQSIETPDEVLSRNVEKNKDDVKVTKTNSDEVGSAVRGEIITERVSPEDPPVRKYVQYDANDNIVSSDPEGSEEFAAAVGDQDKNRVMASMKTKMALHMLRVELPMDVIDEINSHIDESKTEDASNGLVGQISQNDKSAQRQFSLDDEVGRLVKGQLDLYGKSYVKKGFGADVTADTFEAWTVHSYSGDFNPLHSHGVRTEAGLSCILYLKVPECIQKISDPSEEGLILNQASGDIDGFTYFTWGDGDVKDVNRFRPITEEYVKPEVGTMLIFPNWLRHAVMPFFGKGERRTFSANLNIFDNSMFEKISEEDKIKHIQSMRK